MSYRQFRFIKISNFRYHIKKRGLYEYVISTILKYLIIGYHSYQTGILDAISTVLIYRTIKLSIPYQAGIICHTHTLYIEISNYRYHIKRGVYVKSTVSTYRNIDFFDLSIYRNIELFDLSTYRNNEPFDAISNGDSIPGRSLRKVKDVLDIASIFSIHT